MGKLALPKNAPRGLLETSDGKELGKALMERMESLERGEGAPMTPADWGRLRMRFMIFDFFFPYLFP